MLVKFEDKEPVIENNALIGMNATVLGVPCEYVRMATEEDLAIIRNTQENYEKLTLTHLKKTR